MMLRWLIALSVAVVGAVTGLASFGWLQDVMQSRFERAAERLYASASRDVDVNLVSHQADDSIAWQVYSPELLEQLVRDGRPVFIDFTADWCLTCKSNEAAAIETPETIAALRNKNVVALRADKTESNVEADKLLRQLGNSAASIPFYAFFPADNPNAPITMDGLYASPKPFVDAITLTAGGPTYIATQRAAK